MQILSQIECEYNIDLLKRKIQGVAGHIEGDRLFNLYILGMNTL